MSVVPQLVVPKPSHDVHAQSAEPHPDMQKVLRALDKLGPKPIETLTPDEARQQPTPADAVGLVLKEAGKSTAPEAVAKVENRTIQGTAGTIPIRIYWPDEVIEDALPVVHYIHGGGWVIADLDVYDASPRAIANAAHAIVVSSHYRLAPEHRFPAAHEDSFDAYKWVLAHARSLGGDPRRIAVAGESAGGNMAAAICLMARGKRIRMPVHQVLIYPVTNYAFDTPSYHEHQDAKPLGKAGMQWFFRHYLQSAADGEDRCISLVRSKDLSGLPSTTIIAAEIDPLRSEGEDFAAALKAAGVRVEYKSYAGVTHEFFGMGALIPQAKDAVKLVADRLSLAFMPR